MTYPNGRIIAYNYASGLDNSISRLSSISDGSTTLENYDYLGYGLIVRRGHPESGVDLTYIDSSSTPTFDPFARIASRATMPSSR